ncbi:MAG TPA: alpha/beta family hydrolase [Casimicrobiaceae bacterium]
MSTRRWTVGVGSHAVTAELDPARTDRKAPAFVFAHGAGGHMADRGMLALASLLCTRGLHVVRFNFPYSERRSRRPDPMPVLQECIAAVMASARDEIDVERWIIGGRSMGGRAASMLAADGFACAGLLLLAYPLHPAGEPEKLRDAHLARIAVPVLCLNGTRDPLCTRDLMDGVVAKLPDNFHMHWLEGADHSFHVPKTSGRSDADVLAEIGDATQRWLGVDPT